MLRFQRFLNLFSIMLTSTAPDIVVVVCGADAVAGGRNTDWNLSSNALPKCLQHIRQQGVRMLVLGGQGAHATIAARSWARCTAALVGMPVEQFPADVPSNDAHVDAYAVSGGKTEVVPTNMVDTNTDESLAALVKAAKMNMNMEEDAMNMAVNGNQAVGGMGMPGHAGVTISEAATDAMQMQCSSSKCGNSSSK